MAQKYFHFVKFLLLQNYWKLLLLKWNILSLRGRKMREEEEGGTLFQIISQKYCEERAESWKIKKSFILIRRVFLHKVSVFCLSLHGVEESVMVCFRSSDWPDLSHPRLWLANTWLLPGSRCLWVAWLFQLFDRYSCNCLYTSVTSIQSIVAWVTSIH